MINWLFVTLAATATAGCSESSPETPDATPDAGSITGSSIGSFRLQLVGPRDGNTGYTSLIGKVYDAVQPATIIWTEAARAGSCALVTPRVPFCATPCGSNAACVADDTCQPYAASRSVGTVHASGIRTAAGASEFDMTPIVNAYQPTGSAALAYPAFAEGDAIELAAAGSAFTDGFTLHSTGIAALALDRTTYPIAAGTPLTVGWTAPTTAGVSTVHVKLDISHHGGTKGMIECDADDTGSLTLDASLIEQLLDLGASGYPTIIVTRTATGSANVTGGHVDLVVASELELPVAISGLDSCTDTTQCPTGETCQPDQTCN